jgi:hypothetical protein
MNSGTPLPSPPPPRPAPQPSQTERWAKSRQGKIALTVIAGLYLFGQFVAMVAMIVIFTTSSWWLPNDAYSPPWPFFLFWIPGFLIQMAIMGVVIWLLWKEPKHPTSV